MYVAYVVSEFLVLDEGPSCKMPSEISSALRTKYN